VNDTLLTPEEQNAAAERGVQKWLAQLTEPTAFESSAPFVYAEVCRAQVRKVAEWMKERDQMRDFPETEMFKACLMLSPHDWQALKAAGEKEVGR